MHGPDTPALISMLQRDAQYCWPMQERKHPLHSAAQEKEIEKKGESCHHLHYMFWLLSLLSSSTGHVASIPIVSVIVNRSITFGWLSSFKKSIILGFCGELVDRTGYFSVEVWISSNPLQMCFFLVHSWHSFLEESPLLVAVDRGLKNERRLCLFRGTLRHILQTLNRRMPHLSAGKEILRKRLWWMMPLCELREI